MSTNPLDDLDDEARTLVRQQVAHHLAADRIVGWANGSCTCSPICVGVALDYDPDTGGRFLTDVQHAPGCVTTLEQSLHWEDN